MRFLLRAAFWLSVMWAVMPHGGGAGLAVDDAAGALSRGAAAAGAAIGRWCAGTPAQCLALPRTDMAAASPQASSPPPRAAAAVPIPASRPRAFARRS
jgi:hypothetical protein